MVQNNVLVPVNQERRITRLAEIVDAVQKNLDASLSENTKRSYASDWSQFRVWCARENASPELPLEPALIAGYISALGEEGKKPNTIARAVAAIGYYHRLADVEDMTRRMLVTKTLAGLRRRLGGRVRKARALTVADLRSILFFMPANLTGTRNIALLLLGFAGTFRRSELVALNVEDIAQTPEGLEITIRRSKTDQDGVGAPIGIPFGEHRDTCPVRAYQAWLREAHIDSGAAFRVLDRHGNVYDERLSDRAVDRIIKQSLTRAGIDPTPYSGHSLRSGGITAAARNGAGPLDIMQQSRHRNINTLAGYVQQGQLLGKNNVVRKMGL